MNWKQWKAVLAVFGGLLLGCQTPSSGIGSRVFVVERESASQEVLESMMAPIAGFQIEQAPVVIVWYLDFSALDVQGDRLHELMEARVMGVDLPKAKAMLDDFLIPFFKNAMPVIKVSGLTEFDCGQGVAQATLVAVDEGLGTACLGTVKEEEIKLNLKLPDDSKLLVLMCVGYPAESREAGGQRPRLPFDELFALNEVGHPYPRDPAVVAELERSKLLQQPAPLPWRQQELEYLQQGLDLPDF